MSGAVGNATTIAGLTTTSYTVDTTGADLYYYRVQAVSDDGTSQWSDWMDVDIAAPVTEIPEDREINGKIFDLTGRRLQRIPWRGIFIRNGKSYLVH